MYWWFTGSPICNVHVYMWHSWHVDASSAAVINEYQRKSFSVDPRPETHCHHYGLIWRSAAAAALCETIMFSHISNASSVWTFEQHTRTRPKRPKQTSIKTSKGILLYFRPIRFWPGKKNIYIYNRTFSTASPKKYTSTELHQQHHAWSGPNTGKKRTENNKRGKKNDFRR